MHFDQDIPDVVPKSQIINIAALIQIMACRRLGDKPLSEPMMVSLLTHIWVTPFRSQWVNTHPSCNICYTRCHTQISNIFTPNVSTSLRNCNHSFIFASIHQEILFKFLVWIAEQLLCMELCTESIPLTAIKLAPGIKGCRFEGLWKRISRYKWLYFDFEFT